MARCNEALRAVSECLRLPDIKERHRRRSRPRVVDGTIYFIGPREGIVKIGFTTDLEERMRRLQCGSPVALEVIATVAGDTRLEREYHRRFADARQHGEWFLRTIDVEAEIERLSTVGE